MNDKYEEYQSNADACIRMSRTTANERFQASWLKLAEAWLHMIPSDHPPADEQNPKSASRH